MKSRTILFCLFFIASFVASSQEATAIFPKTNPQSVGISEERLALLDAHISQFIDEGHIPGGVFMIARQGKIFYNKTFGERSPGVAYKTDDIFRLASMTKAFTSVSIMQLYEKGKLGLDDPIFYYIPGFKDPLIAENINQADSTYTTRPAKKQITIRSLLTHTSGITYGVFQGGAIQHMYDEFGANAFGLSHESINTVDMAKIIAKVPLLSEPGEKYSYGLNMEVLGAIVEVVSGMTLSEYFMVNIFQPLGLTDTDFYLPDSKHDRLVPLYTFDDKGKMILSEDETWDYPKEKGRTNFAGGGGMSGTAMDYLVFIQALLDEGKYNGTRILSRKTIEVMTSDQLILQNEKGNGFSGKPGITYGLGFSLKTDEGSGIGHKSPGTFEWGGMFNTKFFIDPEEDLVFVGMTNVLPFYRGDFWNKFYAIMYGAIDD